MLYPWQTDDWARLNLERERLPNAWLLTGPDGIGKGRFARHLAMSLLCDAPGAGYHPCGRCEACHWFEAGSHPDFRLLAPPVDDEGEGGKTGRKLAQIKVDAVREVIDFAHLTAHRGRGRVVLVEPAESLNPTAANALLKILEEPPADVLFLLLADAPQRLLPTIKSRCRPFQLSRPDRETALAWLAEQGIENAQVEYVYHGEVPLFEHDPALVSVRREFIDGLAAPGFDTVNRLAELVEKHKLPLTRPVQWLQKWLLDLAGLRLAGHIRYHPQRRAALEALAGRADLDALMRCQTALTGIAPYGQHPLNVKLQVEALLMDYLSVFIPARPAATR